MSNWTFDGLYFGAHKTECVPENLNSRHCHDAFEILYVVDGYGKYMVEGVEYPVKPRTLMVFPPFSYHCVSIVPGTAYERKLIHFDAPSVAEPAKSSFISFFRSMGATGTFFSPDKLPDAINSIFDRIENISVLPEKERENYAKLLLSELIIFLSCIKSDNFICDDGELGARVIRYLNDNIIGDLSLDKLAKRFFVSKYYLCRAFKKHNGVSIHGYINHKRVMYAKQLLEEGETASSAAYRVGFGDYSAFYRAYVKIVGTAPTKMEDK